jgi:hypothetical protein
MRSFKRVTACILAALLLCAFVPASAAGGDVTITSVSDLFAFAQRVNSGESFEGRTVTLTANLTVNSLGPQSDAVPQGNFVSWTPIGTKDHPFQGTFDGGGYTITGLYAQNSEDYYGLFGVVEEANIYNVTVKDSYFSVADHAGAVVGYARDDSVIASCHNDGSTVITENRSGGIVGWTSDSHVYNCSASGTYYSKRCCGGIVGDVYSNSKIYNCVSYATVNGKELVGGISGGSTRADIQNCLYVGENLYSGGYLMAGGGGSRTLTNCFALSSETVNSGLSMGTGSSTAKTFSTTSALLDEAMTVNGQSCSTVLAALNAWVSVQDDELDYSPWVQTSLYPYLRDGVTSAITTSYGSEISQWSSAEMEEAYQQNLIPDVLMGEDLTKPITRAEFAAVCVKVYENLAHTAAIPAVVNPFVDCADTEVLKAYNVGITDGTGANTFSPDVYLSREQAATMLTRTFKRVSIPTWTLATDSQFPLDFTMPALFADDANISSFARESVYFMTANGIIGGVGNNTFAPRNMTDKQTAEKYANATREQALAIALRMVKNL